jgi:glycosyltransferase involved in cell wall biosynthesis
MSDRLSVGFLTPEYVTPEQPDGGIANYLRKVAWELAERGHHATVFVWSRQDRHREEGKIRVIEVKIPGESNLPQQIRFRLERVLPAIKLYRAAKKMEKAVWSCHDSTPFSILQTSSYKAPGFTLRRNNRIPLVCRVSSYTPQVRSAFGATRGFAEYLSDWFEIRQALDADAAFAPSKFVAQTFERFEGIHLEVLRTPLPEKNNEFDPTLFESRFAGLTYILFLGSLSKIKGVDLFANAIPEVLRVHPDVHFLFVGRDDGIAARHNGKWKVEQAMNFILSQCQDYRNRIHHLGSLGRALLNPLIANATGVALPSRVDNYPNACLEAHTFGIPVIGTTDSSLEEMIVDRKTGFLIENGNAAGLASAINSLISMEPEERNQMKENIHEHVKEMRSEDRIGQLIEFYRKTIDGFKRRHAAT